MRITNLPERNNPINHYRSELVSNDQDKWLKLYYFARAAFSVVWVVAALIVGRQSSSIAAFLLIVYPVWDAAANYVDAFRNGGLAANRTQAFNVAVSLVVALAVVIALAMNMNWVSAFLARGQSSPVSCNSEPQSDGGKRAEANGP